MTLTKFMYKPNSLFNKIAVVLRGTVIMQSVYRQVTPPAIAVVIHSAGRWLCQQYAACDYGSSEYVLIIMNTVVEGRRGAVLELRNAEMLNETRAL
jgi:hypothetical protein